MKINRCGLLLLLALVGLSVFGQDANYKLSMKLLSLQQQGKFREELPVLDSIIRADSLIRSLGKKTGQATGINRYVLMKAEIYQDIGDYTRAELLLHQALSEGIILAEKGNPSYYRGILDDLSKLYEKMGNEDNAEAILEEMIIAEFGQKDEKAIQDSLKLEKHKAFSSRNPFKTRAQYFAYYFKINRTRDSLKKLTYLILIQSTDSFKNARRSEYLAHYLKLLRTEDSLKKQTYLKLIQRTDSLNNARRIANYKRLLNIKYDTNAVLKILERNWFTDSLRVKTDSIYQNQPIPDYGMMAIVKAKRPFKRPTARELMLLKSGEMKFTGERNWMSIIPWENVQRLFMIYEKKNNYKAAEALIKQAIYLDDHISPNNPYSYMPSKAQLADIEKVIDKELQKYKDQVLLIKQALNIYYQRPSGADIYYIQNKVLLALLYKQTGKNTMYKLLADTINNICKMFKPDSSEYLMHYLADSYTAIGKYDDAELLYKKLIYSKPDNFSSSINYLSSLKALGKIYIEKGDYKNAETLFKQAIAYDKTTAGEVYPDHLNRVLDLTQLYESTGRWGLAEKYCNWGISPAINTIKNNFSFLSEQEKLLWLNSQTAAFDFSASLLVTDPNPSSEFILQTLNQQLELKGLVLNDEEKVFNNIRESGDQSLKELVDDWHSNRKAIAWQYNLPPTEVIRHLADSLSEIANEQEKKINQKSGTFKNNRQNQQIDFKQIQNHLNKNEAAIEFVTFNYYHKKWTGSIKYGAFVILSDDPQPRFIPLCSELQLSNLLNNNSSSSFIDFYGYKNLKPGHRKSDTLYNLIWKPILPFIKDKTKIDIAPAGLLNRIAFNVLPAEGNEYLLDNLEIRQFSSTREIVKQKIEKNNTSTTSAVVYGDINYGLKESNKPSDNSFLPLNTLKEVNEIDSLFKVNSKTVKVITGTSASEESLKQLSGSSPWLLHIATHGFLKQNAGSNYTIKFNPINKQLTPTDNPMFRSGIAMAGANRVWSGGLPVAGKEDGIVTAYEIAGLDFSNTDLVVLSACETALGDIKGAEGVFGLQRAFKLAGVQNMLLSLWSIPDKETSELMKQFYINKLSGMDNFQAFNSAQKSMRKIYAPFYWAGFVLIE